MKYLIPILLTLCIPMLTHGQDIDPPQSGYISLQSEPCGADVFLGDSLLGHTPLRIDRRYGDSVRVYFPSRSAWNAQVQRLPNAPLHAGEGVVLLRFKNTFQLRSLPHGAAVYRGDSLLGRTPLDVDRQAGTLRLEAVGYLGVDFDPRSTTRASALVMLQPLQEKAMHGEVQRNGSGFHLPAADILVPAGVGLLAGVAAVMLKQEADAKYDSYLSTGDEELLSQTKKYDIYAGISLALLQLGLGYFIYRLFDE
ncbi:hypothetical protein KQI65_03490 [bacterium]|nr:hypothetical protein [bacterium]